MPTLTRTTSAAPCLGPAAILHRAYAGHDLGRLTNALVARALAPVADPGAVMDLATILQCRGAPWATEGLALQRQAAALQPSYQISHGTGTGPRIAALVTFGDFMANTPVDFLLNHSDAVLILHYVDADSQSLNLPPHDALIMAVGESAANRATLANIARLLADYPRPVFNNSAARIATLTRDRVADLLAHEPSILAPKTRRLTRAELADTALPFPLLLRPIDSHAGHDLDLIADATELARWLAETPTEHLYAAPFIDYRGPDGLYAKQRVVLVHGQPFASHQASSTHWMVHYLNADMHLHADRRMAEAQWMATFDTDFARRHAKAFAALHRIFGLDYFGIDCAETRDGRLLVFELDIAMIVHDMDDEALFPYKKPAMKKLFEAFLAAVAQPTQHRA